MTGLTRTRPRARVPRQGGRGVCITTPELGAVWVFGAYASGGEN